MSGVVPLGLLTSSASGPSRTRLSSRRQRYKLQALIGDLLPGERVASCGWRPVPHQPICVYRSASSGAAFIGGVQVCGSVWTCPVCAAKIAMRRAVELRQAMEAHSATGGAVSMLTLTVDHSSRDSLAVLLSRFKRSLKRLFSGRAAASWRESVGYVGMVKAFEVTWGERSGWHPHVHIILFTARPVEAAEVGARWALATGLDGFRVNSHGCRVEPVRSSAEIAARVADYLAKHGVEASSWSAEHEATWANIKQARGERFTPFDLARSAGLIIDQDGERVILASLFREFAAEFKGTRQLNWSRGLRAALGLGVELSDEDEAERRVDDAELVGDVPAYIWRAILRLGLRAELLEAAEDLGSVGVSGFCEWVWNVYGFWQQERAA